MDRNNRIWPGPARLSPQPNHESILVICQELFKEDFDVFFRKKGNLKAFW